MNFGEKLKHLRESKGLGVNQLALKSGVNASNISRLENGERKDPTFETVKKLSKALGVSVSYFDEQENDQLTIAAHIDEDTSDEEMEEILDYIAYIKSKHRKK
ncbi:helix-turn-helix domain-containing protein [Enterococcus sp. AZ192]|uniref:helix-turn-helix domain-containing protein n=1 Tax=unclassified Enterococcus TaxID=2608891 RepID=UPI003D2729E7